MMGFHVQRRSEFAISHGSSVHPFNQNFPFAPVAEAVAVVAVVATGRFAASDWDLGSP